MAIMKKKVTRLQSMDLKPPKLDPVPPMRPTNAMQAGSDERVALEGLMRDATPEEIANFRAQVEKRTTKIPNTWLRCDLPRCGVVVFGPAKWGGAACVKCNYRATVEGGHLRLMSEAAVTAHLKVLATNKLESLRREKMVALEVRNKERTAAGLLPITFAQHQAEVAGFAKSRADREQRLGEVYAADEVARRAR
jgi:hypothetical protein